MYEERESDWVDNNQCSELKVYHPCSNILFFIRFRFHSYYGANKKFLLETSHLIAPGLSSSSILAD